jgi:hypothetical protein
MTGRSELHPVVCTKRNGRNDRSAPTGTAAAFSRRHRGEAGRGFSLAPEAAVLNELVMALVGAIDQGLERLLR